MFLKVGVPLAVGVARGVAPIGDTVTLLDMLGMQLVLMMYSFILFFASLKNELLALPPHSLTKDPRGFVYASFAKEPLGAEKSFAKDPRGAEYCLLP